MKLISFLLITCLCLSIMTGCTASKSEQQQETKQDAVLLSIEKAYVPVSLMIKGSKDFEGKKEVIFATELSGDKIIREVSSCAKMTDHFGASYSIWGADLKNARYQITPNEKQSELIELGINYYFVILEAEYENADSVEVQYNSDITIKNASGRFNFMVLASEDKNWSLGKTINNISGYAYEPGDIVLTYNQNGYVLSSNVMLKNVRITGSETTNGAYQKIATQAIGTSNKYSISFDGVYNITTEGGLTLD